MIPFFYIQFRTEAFKSTLTVQGDQTVATNQLYEESYRCGDDATCDERHGVRRCYCNDGYEGDGTICTPEVVAKDCHELYVAGINSDGVYTIYPDGYPSGIQVNCEMESNGGGWTVSDTSLRSTLATYMLLKMSLDFSH